MEKVESRIGKSRSLGRVDYKCLANQRELAGSHTRSQTVETLVARPRT